VESKDEEGKRSLSIASSKEMTLKELKSVEKNSLSVA